jgi:hypothetical protein
MDRTETITITVLTAAIGTLVILSAIFLLSLEEEISCKGDGALVFMERVTILAKEFNGISDEAIWHAKEQMHAELSFNIAGMKENRRALSEITLPRGCANASPFKQSLLNAMEYTIKSFEYMLDGEWARAEGQSIRSESEIAQAANYFELLDSEAGGILGEYRPS